MTQRLILSVMLLLISATLCGCVRTLIRSEPDDPHLAKLLSLNQRLIDLDVVLETSSPERSVEIGHSLGHQYLFFVIPFGRIESAGLIGDFTQRAVLQLGLRGYRPNGGSTASRLTITIVDAQLTAYDLFFVREIYCSFKVVGELTKNGIIVARAESRPTQRFFRALAFERELRKAYFATIDEGIKQLLNDVGLQ